ncbi:hypothetical protein, partial [Phyllobacterium sp.]|uniref:hypothetical protein n=1 Tax=Phyllobacterium sp. TaxID=1871046 RepID=UPI0031FDD5CB|nr:hypothetical protein [Phyllobacterium sp.]
MSFHATAATISARSDRLSKFRIHLMSSVCAALLAGSLVLAAGPALAEAVLHRGNSGEPQTLDPSQTSLEIEAFIL